MPSGAYHKLSRRDGGAAVARTYRVREATADSLLALAEVLGVSVSDLADYVIAEGLAAVADGRIAPPRTRPATVKRIVR
jgi:hypothetical protein